ncbi:CDP-glucose 4,6-dehydratase, partial [Candidatus Pacearchaeota archaeon]|nr:CDP-glucose 4,6-dehydratase [Candidatus Pacearchaeota archaeon]
IHPHEANHLKLDCSKAHTQLHWQPRWTLNKALEKIIAWHKAEISGMDLKQLCLEQIDEYTHTTN